jgi:hypothetical protein
MSSLIFATNAIGSIGLIFPASMSIGQAQTRHAPGIASAVLGGLSFLLGALASPLVGLFGTGSSVPIAVIMLIALAAALLALLGHARPCEHDGEPR